MNNVFKELKKHKILGDEIVKNDRKFERISTGVITLNLLFSGNVTGGILKGAMTMMSAPSQLGKTFVGLNVLKNAQRAGMNCVVLHTEKKFDFEWAKKVGVDISEDKLMVLETSNLTKLKQIFGHFNKTLTREERENTFILLDSWGAIVTTVQQEKAADGSETRDMSDAYWKNQLANIISDSDTTCFVLNHVYDNTGGFGDPLNIPGGRKLYFVCTGVVMGTSVAKDRDTNRDILGDIVTAKTHKGRGVKRYTTLKYRIKQNGGLDLFYGILDDALEHGCVYKPKNGRYSRSCIEDDKEWKENKIYCQEFWSPIFKDTDFAQFLENKYTSKQNELDVAKIDIQDVVNGDIKYYDTNETIIDDDGNEIQVDEDGVVIED